MGRAEDRAKTKKQKQEDKRESKFGKINNLKMLEDSIIEEANKLYQDRTKDDRTVYVDMLRAGIGATLIEDTDMSIKEIREFGEKVEKYGCDLAEMISSLKEKDDKLEDVMAKVKKLEEAVYVVAIELCKEGLKKKDVVEKLIYKFSGVSKTGILNAYKTAYEDSRAEKIVEIMEPKEAVAKVSKKDVEEVIAVDLKEPVKVIKKADVEIKTEITNNIKVKKMELTGAFGTYKVEGKKVSVKIDKKFDKKNWDKFKAEMEIIFEMTGGR